MSDYARIHEAHSLIHNPFPLLFDLGNTPYSPSPHDAGVGRGIKGEVFLIKLGLLTFIRRKATEL